MQDDNENLNGLCYGALWLVCITILQEEVKQSFCQGVADAVTLILAVTTTINSDRLIDINQW